MKFKLISLFLLALVLRLLIIPLAHHGDLNNNISWGVELINRGIDGYYGSSDANDWPYSAPNQPPLYILLFGFIVWTYNLIDYISRGLNNSLSVFPSSFIWFWEIRGMDLLAKLPGILADLAIGLSIYHYLVKKLKHKNKPLIITMIWLFNPIVWYSSAVWGQTDSLVNFLGLISIMFLLQRKLVMFAILFTLAFLFKGSLLMFAPVLLILIYKQKYALREYLLSVVCICITIFAISIWFHPYIDFPMWLFNLYLYRIFPGEIGYLTANAFNFWWLVDPGKVLDSNMYFGLTARVWGLIMTLLGIILMVIFYMKNKLDDKKLFLLLALVSLMSFLFLTRIHERYMYPFFPFATLAIYFTTALWIPYLILSIVHLLNLYHLFWAPSFPIIEDLYTYSQFSNILSILTILMFTRILYIFIKENVQQD